MVFVGASSVDHPVRIAGAASGWPCDDPFQRVDGVTKGCADSGPSGTIVFYRCVGHVTASSVFVEAASLG